MDEVTSKFQEFTEMYNDEKEEAEESQCLCVADF